MRAFGVTFDSGFTSTETTTREPFDPAIVRREMQFILNELHCDAVRDEQEQASWESKAAFHALATYGRNRADGASAVPATPG